MLFNKDYLFIHIPRTAGKCIKSSILNHLQGPNYLCQANIKPDFFNTNNYIDYNEFLQKNCTHFSLKDLSVKKMIWPEGLWENRIDFNQFKIITCARNPYDRIKSLYKLYAYSYWVSCYKSDRRDDFCDDEPRENFENLLFKVLGDRNYKIRSRHSDMFRSTYEYCNVNEQMPKNLHFIRYDNLNEDLSNLFGVQINTERTRHNVLFQVEPSQEQIFAINDKDKAVELINQWESWGIENKLFEPVTKDMLL
jgi:Sulfotransferase domain